MRLKYCTYANIFAIEENVRHINCIDAETRLELALVLFVFV